MNMNPIEKGYHIANVVLTPTALILFLTQQGSANAYGLAWVVISGLINRHVRGVVLGTLIMILKVGIGGIALGLVGFLVLAVLVSLAATVVLIAVAVIVTGSSAYSLIQWAAEARK